MEPIWMCPKMEDCALWEAIVQMFARYPIFCALVQYNVMDGVHRHSIRVCELDGGNAAVTDRYKSYPMGW